MHLPLTTLPTVLLAAAIAKAAVLRTQRSEPPLRLSDGMSPQPDPDSVAQPENPFLPFPPLPTHDDVWNLRSSTANSEETVPPPPSSSSSVDEPQATLAPRVQFPGIPPWFWNLTSTTTASPEVDTTQAPVEAPPQTILVPREYVTISQEVAIVTVIAEALLNRPPTVTVTQTGTATTTTTKRKREVETETETAKLRTTHIVGFGGPGDALYTVTKTLTEAEPEPEVEATTIVVESERQIRGLDGELVGDGTQRRCTHTGRDRVSCRGS